MSNCDKLHDEIESETEIIFWRTAPQHKSDLQSGAGGVVLSDGVSRAGSWPDTQTNGMWMVPIAGSRSMIVVAVTPAQARRPPVALRPAGQIALFGTLLLRRS